MTGTLNLLEEAARRGVTAFVFTSTTSVFGRADASFRRAGRMDHRSSHPGPEEHLRRHQARGRRLVPLSHRNQRLPCLVLRTSRFFPEADDDAPSRGQYDDANMKANEFLYRRVELQDVVDAHLFALEKAAAIGFGRYIISATTPFLPSDVGELRVNAPEVVARYSPNYQKEYDRRGWTMFFDIERVYVNERAGASSDGVAL